MDTISEGHNLDFFSPSEMLLLARAGRVFCECSDGLSSYPYLVLSQPFFDLTKPCLGWRINSQGEKAFKDKGFPQLSEMGRFRELDFSPTNLRQAYMDHACERLFVTLFEFNGALATGIGRAEKMAAKDAAFRIGRIAGAIDDPVQVSSLRSLQRALLKGEAVSVDHRQAKSLQELDFPHEFISHESFQAFQILRCCSLLPLPVISPQLCTELFEPYLLAGGILRSQLLWVDSVAVSYALDRALKNEFVIDAVYPSIGNAKSDVQLKAEVSTGMDDPKLLIVDPPVLQKIPRSVRFSKARSNLSFPLVGAAVSGSVVGTQVQPFSRLLHPTAVPVGYLKDAESDLSSASVSSVRARISEGVDCHAVPVVPAEGQVSVAWPLSRSMRFR